MFKESYGEKKGTRGCLIPLLAGAILGAVIGVLCSPEETVAGTGMGMMFAMMGGGVGIVLGGITGFVIDRIITAKERRDEEF